MRKYHFIGTITICLLFILLSGFFIYPLQAQITAGGETNPQPTIEKLDDKTLLITNGNYTMKVEIISANHTILSTSINGTPLTMEIKRTDKAILLLVNGKEALNSAKFFGNQTLNQINSILEKGPPTRDKSSCAK